LTVPVWKGAVLERLWAPWRLEFISQHRPDGCIFCDKPLCGDDRAAYIVQRGTHAYVMLNAFPYNSGHLMVIPYTHAASLQELPQEVLHEIMDLTQLCSRALSLAMAPDGLNAGFNLGAAAGAGIKDHIHFHVVPRWLGDTNFMPVLADVRVIPQSLDHAYTVLRQAFVELVQAES
jgi:ATP adenylyltransferase